MRDFVGERLPSIQNAILQRMADDGVHRPCRCNNGDLSLFRCQDCDTNKLSCAKCLVEAHRHNWFHWAEKWTGEFFEKTDMSTLGLTIPLGHAGDSCPDALFSSTEQVSVVDINGIHIRQILYCHCDWQLNKHLQLIRNGLFPSTVRKPSLLFTIRLLDDFHTHMHASRKSAYDYMKAIRRKTNDNMPDYVKVRSRNISQNCTSNPSFRHPHLNSHVSHAFGPICQPNVQAVNFLT